MQIDPRLLAEFEGRLSDPMWRLCNLYKITIKGREGDASLVITFNPNREQRRFIKRLWYRNIILKPRQRGFCLAPATRVLTADLRWVAIASLKEGDQVVAVDENVPGGRGSARKMRTATVQVVAEVRRAAYRIRFDDGREVVCTAQHPWLSRKIATDCKWRSIDGTGNKVSGRIKVGTQVRWVTKPWDDAQTYEDGWFGGILDGEGSMALASRAGVSINASQREGEVWNRMIAYAGNQGYSYRIEEDAAERPSKFGKTGVPKVVFSRMDEVFRLIGKCRPTRFVGNRFWEGRELPGKRNGGVGWARIVSIDPVGEQTMIDLQTSTGTYIAEGFVSHNTTLVALLWLDHALFNANVRCGIVAHDRDSAEVIFRDKVKFAYDNLPPELKEAFPLQRDSASELLFAHNNSSVRVATSMRSGTIHRLHISEYGKICAKYPDKADEVMTGSLPAVPESGIVIIESTAEGQEGDFHAKSQIALAAQQQRKELSPRDYRMHFFAWWEADEYSLDRPELITITETDEKYFREIEAKIGRPLLDGQRAWYVAVMNSDMGGDRTKMKQEYPGTPEEAFSVSTEGCYYANEMALARIQGRICRIPVVDVPVNTFWDIGRSDFTAIWFHQQIGLEHRFIKYHEATGEKLGYYVKYLQDTGFIWGTHYLPHDADHKRLSDTNESIKEMLEKARLDNIEIVPRVSLLGNGIQATRNAFGSCYFDETECAEGIKRLSNYKKKWSPSLGCFTDEDQQDDNVHGADAFRQFGQMAETGEFLHGRSTPTPARRPAPDWRVAC